MALPKFNSKVHPLIVLCALLTLSFINRAAYFVVDVIDWDESTFILMGQGLLDGLLPYTRLWDIKPPALFAVFAFVIWIFGKGIIGIRVAGMLMVAIVAYQTFLIGSRFYGFSVGLMVAVLCVITIGLTPSGQATLSELVALPFLLGSLLYLMRSNKLSSYLFAGGLLALACLVRLNLGFIVIAVCVLLLIDRSIKFKERLLKTIVFCSGGILISLWFVLPYILAEKLDLLYFSTIEVPFLYSRSQQDPLSLLVAHVRTIVRIKFLFLVWPASILGILVSMVTVHAIFTQDRIRNDRPTQGSQLIPWSHYGTKIVESSIKHGLTINSHDYQLLIVFILAVIVSIIAGGASFPHYLIQIMPFMCLMAGFSYAYLPTIVTNLALVATVVWCVATLNIKLTNMHANWPIVQGTTVKVSQFLAPRCHKDCTIYFATNHLGYWLLGKLPPTPIVTHPSNIVRSYMLQSDLGTESSPVAEMGKILDQQPTFIVKRPKVFYFKYNAATIVAGEAFTTAIQQYYTLINTIDSVQIYQRTLGK